MLKKRRLLSEVETVRFLDLGTGSSQLSQGFVLEVELQKILIDVGELIYSFLAGELKRKDLFNFILGS